MITAIVLIWLHLIGDFFLQSDEMATRKSSLWGWLLYHVSVYSLCFLPFFGIYFWLITLATHFITDAITSRITSYYWKTEQRHWFFTTIGVDQAIHLTTLILTYNFLQ